MDAIPVSQDCVHAKSAVAGLPLACVLVVADTRYHLPGIAAIAAPEQRRGLDAAPQIFPVVADFVSLNVFPRLVERRTFMPKKALQLEP
jgi:hypothetical protein